MKLSIKNLIYQTIISNKWLAVSYTERESKLNFYVINMVFY